MNILVIGSKGFIGSACADYFSQAGHTVFRADISESDEANYTQLEAVHTSFDKLFTQASFDLCINASGSAHVGFSFEKPEKDFELNVLNVHKILVAIRIHQPQCRLINFSSAAVYGNPESLPISEHSAKNPLSPYGFHKLQSEYLLKEYNRFFQIPTCSVRIFSAYGPGLRKQLFWDLYQKTKQASGNITLFGTGEESRDFIYIDDLVKAIQILTEKAAFDGSSYNVASGIETSIKDAARIFFKNIDPALQYMFSKEQKIGDPDNWVADISALRSMGFEPSVSIEEGLSSTAGWMKSLS